MTEEPQLSKEAQQRIKQAQKRMRRKKRREFIQEHKETIFVCMILALIGAIGLAYVIRFFYYSYVDMKARNKVNAAVEEISQLVGNLRTAYTVHKDEDLSTLDKLLEVGAVSPAMVNRNTNTLVNLFGGAILIHRAADINDEATGFVSPTFKISYQGLPHQACAALGSMDWGGKKHGLLAVAVGYVAENGKDKAFVDIDKEHEAEKIREWVDKTGHQRLIIPRKHYTTNVARPEDSFVPTPMPLHNAETGCSCVRDNCSFALHYAVFGTELKK